MQCFPSSLLLSANWMEIHFLPTFDDFESDDPVEIAFPYMVLQLPLISKTGPGFANLQFRVRIVGLYSIKEEWQRNYIEFQHLAALLLFITLYVVMIVAI